jgi:hypothetical protein
MFNPFLQDRLRPEAGFARREANDELATTKRKGEASCGNHGFPRAG